MRHLSSCACGRDPFTQTVVLCFLWELKSVSCFSGLFLDSFIDAFSFCLTYGFAKGREGERCSIFPLALLSKSEKDRQHLTEQTTKKERGNKEKVNHDGTEDSADPYGGNHSSSGKERRKLLPQLQGQFTHSQVWGQLWSQIFPLIPRSKGFYAAQCVEIDADTAEVKGFISHKDQAEKHLHILRSVIYFRVYICHVNYIDKSDQLCLVNKFKPRWPQCSALRIIISSTFG